MKMIHLLVQCYVRAVLGEICILCGNNADSGSGLEVFGLGIIRINLVSNEMLKLLGR